MDAHTSAVYTPQRQDLPFRQYIPHGKRNMKWCSSPVKMPFSKGDDILYAVCNIWYLVKVFCRLSLWALDWSLDNMAGNAGFLLVLSDYFRLCPSSFFAKAFICSSIILFGWSSETVTVWSLTCRDAHKGISLLLQVTDWRYHVNLWLSLNHWTVNSEHLSLAALSSSRSLVIDQLVYRL